MFVNTTRKKCISTIIFSLFATLVTMAAFCFAGCVQTYRGAGEFSADEVVLAVGEVLDPAQMIDSEFELVFESGNASVLAKQEDGTFIAQRSGQVSLVAKHENNVIDVLSVTIKQKFAAPANIAVSNDGLITWDASLVLEGGQVETATYTVVLDRDGSPSEFVVEDNFYQLSQPGSYTVSVKANPTQNVLGSEFSAQAEFTFALAGQASGLSFVSDSGTFGQQTGILSWQAAGDRYDVTFQGVTTQDVRGRTFSANFANLAEGETGRFEIISYSGQDSSQTATLDVQKIYTPLLTLQDNELFWQTAENAQRYLLNYSSLTGATSGTFSFDSQATNSILNGVQEGIYTLALQAIGQTGYANGAIKTLGNVAKIGNVQYDYEILDDVVRITFTTQSEYNKRFVVKQNGTPINVNGVDYFEFGESQDGVYSQTYDFTLGEGENVFSLQTLPTFDENGQITIGQQSTSMAVKSDEVTMMSAYNVGQIENLRHDIEEGESILVFDEVAYANQFEVSINDIAVSLEADDISTENGTTKIRLGKISSEAYGTNGELYEIKLTATRSPQENEIASVSETSHTLTMLSSPELQALNGAQSEQTYQWQSVEGAKYAYSLFTTGSDFSIEEATAVTGETDSPSLQISEAGYYVLQVLSMPLDNNTHLASEVASQDNFFVAISMESSPIRLDYNQESQRYVLTISTVDFAYEYKISLDGAVLQSVYNTDSLEQLTYIFAENQTFNEAGKEYAITVETIASGEDDQKIHLNSTSTLLVERLQAPTSYSVVESSTAINVANPDQTGVLVLSKDGSEIARGEGGEAVKADLTSYDGAFSINAKVEGYDLFENFTTNGKVMLESGQASFNFYRSSTPTALNYSAGQISFAHTRQPGERANYLVEVTAISANGSASVTFETALTSFDLEELLQPLREQNPEFDSHYDQSHTVNVRIFANISEEVESVYYLPSRYATLLYNPQDTTLSITKLASPQLNYDDTERKLLWNAVEGDNVVYDIYYNRSTNENQLEATISSVNNQQTYEFSIAGYDFSQEGDYIFYIVARSDNALDSNSSGRVIVHKLSQVSGLSVYERGGQYFAGFSLESIELDNIADIRVNGNSVGTSPEFKLASEAEVEEGEVVTVGTNGEVSVQIMGKAFEENGDKTFYISSDVANFVVKPLEKEEYEPLIEISSNSISWEDFEAGSASDWILTNPESGNIRYEIRVYNSTSELRSVISNISSTQLSLSHENLLALVQGNYTFKLYAYVSNYQITSEDGRGYYGRLLLDDTSLLTKLNAVTDFSASIDDSQTTIDEELAKPITLTWNHEGEGTSQISYVIYVNGSEAARVQELSYSLSQTLLNEGDNTIAIKAVSDSDVESGLQSLVVSKFATPEIFVADTGVLTITAAQNPPASEGYIIELKIEEETTTFYSTATTVDLQPHINGRSGNYTVRVIPKSTQKVSVPNESVASASGTILAQPTFVQDQAGITLVSTDADVVFYIRCDEEGLSQMIEGNYFAFPDDWGSGVYNILLYARRTGSVDSWTGESAVQELNLDRIANTTEVIFERSEDYNDQTLTWTQNPDAEGYSLSVYQNDEILFETVLTGGSARLSDIESEHGVLPSGDLTFVFRTLATSDSGKANSQPLTFAVNKLENTISGVYAKVALPNIGYLTFNSSFNGVGTYIQVENASGQIKDYLLSGEENLVKVEEFLGRLQVSARTLATNKPSEGLDRQSSADGILLDADATIVTMNKHSQIQSITQNFDTGRLMLNLANDGVTSGLRFFAEHDGEVREVGATQTSSTNYEIIAANIAELFDLQDGEFVFTLSVYSSGWLISDPVEHSFEFKSSSNTVEAVKGEDDRNDYLIIHGQDASTRQPVTAIILRDLEGNYYSIDLASVTGYWVTASGAERGEFLGAPVEGYTNEAAFVISVNEVLAGFVSGTKNLQVAYVTNENDEFTVVGYCAAITYRKLVAPNSIEIDLGNLTWRADEVGTAYYIYLEGTTQSEIKIDDTNTTYYLGENINKQGIYYVSIQNVSSQLQTLASEKTYVGGNSRQSVSKLATVSDIQLSDGVMQLTYNGAGDLANDINNITDASSSANITAAVNNLLNKTYTLPFRFSLTELVNMEFNLRFENTTTGQVYFTTVKAGNLLTGFTQPVEDFTGDFTGKSVIEAIETILGYTGLQGSARTALQELYDTLTDSTLWTGVASCELLFDEIGEELTGNYNKYPAERIQAGQYNVSIQQQGSQEEATISSDYNQVLSNVTVETSPMITTSVEDNVYYINFRPIGGKNDYTMVLKHSEDTETVIEKVKITLTDGVWRRTDVGGEDFTTTLSTFENGGSTFVRISLNDVDGIGEELTNPTLYTYSVNIFANGDDTTFNSKTEEVSLTFLGFNIDSLTLNAGVFSWDTFTVGNTRYSAQVAYQHYQSSSVTIATPSGTGATQTFTPSTVGNYNYIEFYTPGHREAYAIYVGSEVYRLENISKLQAPSITTQNGQLVFSDNNSALQQRTFILSNNISIRSNLTLEVSSESSSITHTPGLNGLTNDEASGYAYRLTEGLATTFYAAIAGDDVEHFTSREMTDEGGQTIFNRFIINADGLQENETLYLQSASTSISAKMIDYSSNATVDEAGQIISLSGGVQLLNGKVVWPEAVDTVAAPYEILYEVRVETYYATSTDSTNWTLDTTCTRTYYTSDNQLDAALFINSPSDTQRYAIYVKANVNQLDSNGGIVSLQNQTYSQAGQTTFASTLTNVLQGELVFNYAGDASALFERSQEVVDFEINDGTFVWTYEVEDGLSTRFVIEYSIAGRDSWQTLNGQVVSSGQNNYTFVIDEGQLSSTNAYNFRIYAVNYAETTGGTLTTGGQLASNKNGVGNQTYRQISLLKDLTQSDFTTSRVETGSEYYYVVNFQNYYDSNPGISASSINLEITYLGETLTILGSGSSKTLNLRPAGDGEEAGITNGEIFFADGNLTLNIRAVAADINYILSADSQVQINLSETSWHNADSVTYDSESQTFSWTYGAEYRYQSALSEGEEVALVYYYDSEALAFKVYGADVGEPLQQHSGDSGVRVPIIYGGDQVRWIWGSQATFEYLEDEGYAEVTTRSNAQLQIYDEETGSFSYAGTTLPAGGTYRYAYDYFIVQKMLFDDTELTNYYLPISAVTMAGQTAASFTATENMPVYTDPECTHLRGIEAGIDLAIAEDAVVDAGYYQFANFEEFGNGEDFRLKVENVYRYVVQTDLTNPEELIFKVTIQSQQVTVSGNTTTTVTTTREYDSIALSQNEGWWTATFEPNLIGTILSFEVQARRGENNLPSASLSIDCSGGDVVFDLFASGAGTEEDPFIVSSTDEFENMSHRSEKQYYHNTYYQTQETIVVRGGNRTESYSSGTETDTELYYSFRQNGNLSFTNVAGFVIDQPFKGIYDGNGNAISVTFASVADLGTPESGEMASLSGGTEIQFTNGAALFKEISTNGSVSNLTISFSFAYNSDFKQTSADEPTLVAGLALKTAARITSTNEEAGRVSGVTLQGASMAMSTTISAGNVLAVAGIVGKNQGEMYDCVSRNGITISQRSVASGQTFLFSPIALFNSGASASMTYCRNNGNVSISWATNQSNDNSVIQASGIVLTNSFGTIDMCYNSANVTVNTTNANGSATNLTGTRYAAGVVIYSNRGSLISVVNTGAITAGNVGGVAYNLNSTTINNIIAFGSVNGGNVNLFAATGSATAYSGSSCYIHNSGSPTLNVGYTPVSNNWSGSINCYGHSGWRIVVSYTNSTNYSVVFSQT